ncbi:hypothetical protein N6H14_16495 [Paenibacillus sp. CC-CFT747]|nr:hypothetical protein N6H14_16495 [Paenibacillus sp. CC-CFT747]
MLADKPVLEALVRQRSYRIVKEIYAVSNQLLYYNGSRMNLHGKLTRCLPYTRILRNDLRQLLNDWYQDADQALRTFKDRLGTDDGAGFAETLQSMRLHEHEAFYELLKQRIQDFKDKLDLIKEGKKETTSYLLFVLAGLPILNTFRIFIYPWVQEGQKLFQQLN